jgi:selenium-binding protein 1
MLWRVKAHKIGDQVNMLSQSWDGKRIYFTTSLLANWDKGDVPDVEGPPQFFKAFDQRWIIA